VFLHVGLHKTGTTYVQHLMRANRAALRQQGVLYPGGAGFPSQIFAAWDLLGRRPQGGGGRDARIAGAWAAMAEAVAAVPVAEASVVYLCDEHLSLATSRQARVAVESFTGADVHVVVTARDLARVVTSAWQEDVKNRGRFSWTDFIAAVRDPAQVGTNPARSFWLRQDLPVVLETWAEHVGVERVHVVTVPAAGSPSDLLVERLGSLVGFHPHTLTAPAKWANENVGLVGTELLRRLSPRLAHLDTRRFDKLVKLTLVRRLAVELEPVRHALDDDELAWTVERSREMSKLVRNAGYPVVGDLDDLLPRAGAGRRPADVTADELTEAALVALAGLGDEYVNTWWANRRPDEATESSGTARATSAIRALQYQGRRAAAHAADRNALVGRLAGAYLRRRGR
jgi:hypothetical protein